MPTYVYETIPQTDGETVDRFELRQSMNDTPLTRHPETGRPVRRVISGGYGYLGGSKGAGAAAPSAGSHGCGPACGCGH